MSDDLFEHPLGDRLRALAAGAPRPASGTEAVLARVAERRVRRRRRQAIGAVVASTAMVVVGLGLAVRLRGTGGSTDVDSPLAAPVGGDGGGVVEGTTAAPPTSTSRRASVPWPELVAFAAPGFTRTRTEAYDTLRTDGWPATYRRTFTWSPDGSAASADSPYIVVQSESDRTIGADTSVTAGSRTIGLSAVGAVQVATWTEPVADRGTWTMHAYGWHVDRAVLQAAVAGATWNDTAQQWALSLPSPWAALAWPLTGAPREVISTFGGGAGDEVRIDQSQAFGRFAADVVTFELDGHDEARDVTVSGRTARAVRVGGRWQVLWPRPDGQVVRVQGGDGMALDDLLAGLTVVDTASVTIERAG